MPRHTPALPALTTNTENVAIPSTDQSTPLSPFSPRNLRAFRELLVPHTTQPQHRQAQISFREFLQNTTNLRQVTDTLLTNDGLDTEVKRQLKSALATLDAELADVQSVQTGNIPKDNSERLDSCILDLSAAGFTLCPILSSLDDSTISRVVNSFIGSASTFCGHIGALSEQLGQTGQDAASADGTNSTAEVSNVVAD
ncbi:hypothetical protein M231_06340 [Tremella mesenterica]|uniref:Uncharacterized protein n=1 Tax=Tremella mesenterica TaxID=5217 RepID=A0A4Q1BEB5_TREME|nr:hypothetical protein M231_06340 [Tremella mesenterica]